MQQNKTSIIINFALVIFALLLNTGCQTVLSKIFMQEPLQISGPVTIGKEWVELIPPKPLYESGDWSNDVHLVLPEQIVMDARFDEADKKFNTIKYPDGKIGKIEMELFDDKGNVYRLDGIRIGSFPGGFSLHREPTQKERKDDEERKRRFTFTKVRIRSEVTLHCEKVVWLTGDF